MDKEPERKYRKWGDELLPQELDPETGKMVPKLSYPCVAPPMPPEIAAIYERMQQENNGPRTPEDEGRRVGEAAIVTESPMPKASNHMSTKQGRNLEDDLCKEMVIASPTLEGNVEVNSRK